MGNTLRPVGGAPGYETVPADHQVISKKQQAAHEITGGGDDNYHLMPADLAKGARSYSINDLPSGDPRQVPSGSKSEVHENEGAYHLSAGTGEELRVFLGECTRRKLNPNATYKEGNRSEDLQILRPLTRQKAITESDISKILQFAANTGVEVPDALLAELRQAPVGPSLVVHSSAVLTAVTPQQLKELQEMSMRSLTSSREERKPGEASIAQSRSEMLAHFGVDSADKLPEDFRIAIAYWVMKPDDTLEGIGHPEIKPVGDTMINAGERGGSVDPKKNPQLQRALTDFSEYGHTLEDVVKQTEAFQEALYQCPVWTGQCCRGSVQPESFVGSVTAGQVLQLQGFTSFSVSESYARDSALAPKQKGACPVLFVVRPPKSEREVLAVHSLLPRNISAADATDRPSSEGEVVFQPQSWFRVLAVVKQNTGMDAEINGRGREVTVVYIQPIPVPADRRHPDTALRMDGFSGTEIKQGHSVTHA